MDMVVRSYVWTRCAREGGRVAVSNNVGDSALVVSVMADLSDGGSLCGLWITFGGLANLGST